MEKRKLFLMIVLMGTMFLLCACGKKSYSIEDFEKVVEDDSSNFDKAIDIYEWLYENKQEEVKNISQSIDKLFSNLYDNYSDEKLNRGQVESYLDRISKIDTETAALIDSINTKMNKLDASKIAYSEAEKYYAKGEYALAIEKYENVIIEDMNYQDAKNKIILSNEQILNAVLDEVKLKYQDYEPISLTSLEYVQKGNSIKIGTTNEDLVRDVNEQSYNGAEIIFPNTMVCSIDSSTEESCYVTYYLNSNYSSFTGVVYRPYGTLKCTYEWSTPAKVKIYGDSVLLFELSDITQNTFEATKFDIDVTGVRELKIIVYGRWSENGYTMDDWFPKVCLAELEVGK